MNEQFIKAVRILEAIKYDGITKGIDPRDLTQAVLDLVNGIEEEFEVLRIENQRLRTIIEREIS